MVFTHIAQLYACAVLRSTRPCREHLSVKMFARITLSAFYKKLQSI